MNRVKINYLFCLFSVKLSVFICGVAERLKPIYTFGTEKKKKVNRFTNNLEGFTEDNGERLLLKY